MGVSPVVDAIPLSLMLQDVVWTREEPASSCYAGSLFLCLTLPYEMGLVKQNINKTDHVICNLHPEKDQLPRSMSFSQTLRVLLSCERLP